MRSGCSTMVQGELPRLLRDQRVVRMIGAAGEVYAPAAELASRTLWTVLREWSSLQRTPRIVLEELSGVSEPTMIVRITTTFQPQQRYDHRLRDLIQRIRFCRPCSASRSSRRYLRPGSVDRQAFGVECGPSVRLLRR